MCTYDFDWYGSYERRTLDRDTRCSCGRRIPAGTDHRVLVENVEDVRCILCDGDGRGPLVDDYGNVIRYSAADVRFARFLHDNHDVLTRTAIYDEFDLERPCPAPGCIDGYASNQREARTDPQCELCEIATAWLDHHCDNNYGSSDIPAQVAEHDQALDWPSYQDRALIAAARSNWTGYDASCLRGLVRVATAVAS